MTITAAMVADHHRAFVAAKHFGVSFTSSVEPEVFGCANRLSCSYRGGYWDFFELSNGGFYMSPRLPEPTIQVSCDNAFEGLVSSDAFGIISCLYTYSNLSFARHVVATRCAEEYHKLREFALDHDECANIMSAID